MRGLKLSILWAGGFLLVAGLTSLAANSPLTAVPTNQLVQWHFAGTGSILSKKDGPGASLQTVEATALKKHLTGKIASQISRVCLSTNLSNTSAVSAAAERWIDRLWSVQTLGEVHGDGRDITGWRIGAALSDADHSELLASLSTVAAEWGVTPAAGGKSWTLSPGSQLEVVRIKGWTVLSTGRRDAKDHDRFVRQFEKQAPVLEAGTWAHVTLNLASLKSIWSLPAPLDGSVVTLQVSPSGNSLRTTASVRFLQPQSIKTVAWQVPTNTIRDPLISFTALQGTALNWFDTAWIGDWKPPVKPDQMYLWAMDNIPFLSFAALHVPDSKGFLTKTEKDWLAVNSPLQTNRLGLIRSQTNEVALVWNQLPIIVPTLKPAPEPRGDYLLGGLFPAPPTTNNIPGELLRQFVPRTNLVYYDWEVTAPRVQQWLALRPMLNMITSKLSARGSNAAQLWIKAAGPNLGNAVTEATIVSPHEITVVRRSTLGLTAYELTRLVQWFDNPGFPFAEIHQAPPPMIAPPGPRK